MIEQWVFESIAHGVHNIAIAAGHIVSTLFVALVIWLITITLKELRN